MPQLDCVLQIQGVNWPVLIPVDITWKAFQSIITEKLISEPEEMILTYRFTSFALADNAEALTTKEHFKAMITKAKVFLTGKQKPRGGKPFRVILIPTFKNSPLKTEGPGKKEAGKVSHISTHPINTAVTSRSEEIQGQSDRRAGGSGGEEENERERKFR